MLRAVVFDVDFTLAKPGPDLGPDGYRALGLRYGLDLDPSRYEEARAAAFAEVKRHPELDHDEEIWVLFTERVIIGMGGGGTRTGPRSRWSERWAHSAHFELYEDARPGARRHAVAGLRVGLLSNSSRDLADFVEHHGLVADAVLTSHAHGKTKPHASIFRALLGLLEVDAGEAVMVGDTLHDDIEGARAVGMQAVLIDREDRHPEIADRLPDLRRLAHVLGLE